MFCRNSRNLRVGRFSGTIVCALAAVVHANTFAASPGPRPLNVIYDTDMWADIDDALALGMLHALHDRREINLVAVTINIDDPHAADYVEAVNRFYRHPVTLGMVRSGVKPHDVVARMTSSTLIPGFQQISFTQWVSRLRHKDGSLVYPRSTHGRNTPEATAILRKTLARQPDGSVGLVAVGFSTNLARLLQSGPDSVSALSGRDLVRRKVKALYVMAGRFGDEKLEGYGDRRFEGMATPKGAPEFNLQLDTKSAVSLFRDWPTPVIANGVEFSTRIRFPASSIMRDFNYVQRHILVDTYRYYGRSGSILLNGRHQKFTQSWPHDHHTADLVTVLYAARPDRGYFELSMPGTISVLPQGASRFMENPSGLHRFLVLPDSQRARVVEAMTSLASQPPRITH